MAAGGSQQGQVDFALVAYREEGRWVVGSLTPRTAADLQSFVHALRQQQSDGIVLGLISYGDDFFLAVRPYADSVRVLISDASAAGEWAVARQALELAAESGDGDEPRDDPEDEAEQPAGDLGLFADLGVSAMEVAAICSDLDLYPDEMLAQIAGQIGFGPQFEQAVDPDEA